LSNSGQPDVVLAGQRLNRLRTERNRADYDSRRSFSQAEAANFVQLATDALAALDAARIEPTHSQITSAIATYERDVLKTVTSRPTP